MRVVGHLCYRAIVWLHNMKTTTDKIEREVVIKAPITKVWKAITDPTQFCSWFSEGVEGDFEVGSQPVLDEGKYGKVRIAIVGREEPHYFAWRWVSGMEFVPQGFLGNPLEMPHTLVEFRLSEEGESTRVTLIETGFANLPEKYAAENLNDNTGGWDYMLARLTEWTETGRVTQTEDSE